MRHPWRPGPFNTIFQDGLPVAFVDWDSCHPGDRLDDFACMVLTWCIQSLGGVPITTAGLFISLDGVVENPGDWHFPYFNDEMGAAVTATLGAADTVLFGRKTYDSFAGAWPAREAAGGEDAGMAKALGDARKIVVSNQRLEFTWRNSEQLQGGLVEAVAALKNEPGDTNIGLSGSVSVVRQLLAAGLLDELHLLVHPIAVRKGMRLFDEGETPIPLTLISSETFKTGVLNLVYGPAESTGDATYEDAKVHLSQPEQ